LLVKEESEENETVEPSSEETGKEEKEPTQTSVYYVTDEMQQSQYINMFKSQGKQAVILNHNIDTTFITQLEHRNTNYRFVRIDAEVVDDLKEEVSAEELEKMSGTLGDIFKTALNKEQLEVKVEKLKDKTISAVLTLSEEGRRMQDMMKMYGMNAMDSSMFGGESITLNANNALVQYVMDHKENENASMFCQQLYDLALIANRPLNPEEMTRFVARSNEIMMALIEK